MPKNSGYIAEKKIKEELQTNFKEQEIDVTHNYQKGMDLKIFLQDQVIYLEIKSTRAITKNRETVNKTYCYFGKYRLRKKQHNELIQYNLEKNSHGLYCFVVYLNKQQLKQDNFIYLFLDPRKLKIKFQNKTKQPNWIGIYKKLPDQQKQSYRRLLPFNP
ncbi:MAG: hypothetical protein ACOC1X_01410 [Promethearchaeota archaeon]